MRTSKWTIKAGKLPNVSTLKQCRNKRKTTLLYRFLVLQVLYYQLDRKVSWLLINLILSGVLVHLHIGLDGAKLTRPIPPLPHFNSWNTHPIDLKLDTNVYSNKNFKKMCKTSCPLSKVCWRQHTFTVMNNFHKINIFKNFSSNLTEKLFPRVYNDKFNVIQILENNYIESNRYVFAKIVVLKKRLITFAFSVTACGRRECGRPRPDMIFQKVSTYVCLLRIKSDI